MSHFEEVLKVVGLMKSFVIKCDPHVSQRTGNVDVTGDDVIISHTLLQDTSQHYQPQKS